MKAFTFKVDEEFAKQNNEMIKDTRRLQWSAITLGLILLALSAAVFLWWGADQAWGLIGGIILLTFAVVSVIIAAVVPSKVGTAQDLYDTYPLAPAMIVEVNPRDFVIMALVNTNVDPQLPPGWGLALRTVTRVNGIDKPTRGTKIPAVAVQGRRSLSNQTQWDEISPMPIAWATPDASVVADARRAIPEDQWTRLDKSRELLRDVKATDYNLLVL
ncbi:DUF3239 domain-containing protein [Corynebacterium alimapuense]|uniref:DUF3239 domain-containing protein n=1 Tax=Corynebacterium alimapuense TaxID=1576874 RepID=A0A3M8K7W5_9CORY|nr:DUF3239 domain-containing protein [Corynebacterium alimapuense]RNE48652.1 DUF3239 domain-containing protein [Corynebacterium alimapuense]